MGHLNSIVFIGVGGVDTATHSRRVLLSTYLDGSRSGADGGGGGRGDGYGGSIQVENSIRF